MRPGLSPITHKSYQSSLEQSIANANETIDYSDVADCIPFAKGSKTERPVVLSDDVLEDIRQSVLDDYTVDNLIDSN